jgi:hypothetical protein
MKRASEQEVTAGKVDSITQLLEDIFILQASMANMKRNELRAVVALGTKRVNRISRHLGVAAQDWATQDTILAADAPETCCSSGGDYAFCPRYPAELGAAGIRVGASESWYEKAGPLRYHRLERGVQPETSMSSILHEVRRS